MFCPCERACLFYVFYIAVLCTPIPDSSEKHYMVTNLSSRYTFNMTWTAMCSKGYRLLTGNLVRICQDNGTWSGQEPKCTSKYVCVLRCACLAQMHQTNTNRHKDSSLYLIYIHLHFVLFSTHFIRFCKAYYYIAITIVWLKMCDKNKIRGASVHMSLDSGTLPRLTSNIIIAWRCVG